MESLLNTLFFKVILFRVQPRSSHAIVEHFNAYLRQKTQEFKFFRLLGDYDLLLIYRTFDYRSELSYAGTIDSILDSKEMTCFCWNSEGVYERFLRILNSKSIGLSFIKINPELIWNHGLAGEMELIEISKKNLKGEFLIGGNLGWNEITIITSSDSPSEQLDDILKLKSFKTSSSAHLIAKAFTHIGFNFDLFSGEEFTPEKIEFPINRDPQKKIRIGIYISCDHENLEYVRQVCRESAGHDVVDVLGTADLLARIEVETWGHLMKVVRDIRRGAGRFIYSTNVVISRSVEGELVRNEKLEKQNYNHEKIERRPKIIKVQPEKVSEIQKSLGEWQTITFLNTVYSFNSLFQNELVTDSFLDLYFYVQEMLDKTPMKLKAEEKTLPTMMMRNLDVGIKQRALGALNTSFLNVENTTFHRAGFQRILQAIRLIPLSITQKLDLNWNGFINVTMESRFHTRAQVMMMPVDSLFDVSQWWGLFHETGHYVALYHTDRFKLRSGSPLREELEGIFKNHRIPETEWEEYYELVNEVLSETFGYLHGFMGDYELYLKVSANYLLDHYIKLFEKTGNIKNLTIALIRMFLVHYFQKFKPEDPNSKFYITGQPNKEISFFFELLQSNGLGVERINPQTMERIKIFISRAFAKLYTLFDVLNYEFNSLSPNYSKIKELYNNKEIVQTADLLYKGNIVLEQIDHPEVIVTILVKKAIGSTDRKVPFVATLATILSFWNSYKLGAENKLAAVAYDILEKPR